MKDAAIDASLRDCESFSKSINPKIQQLLTKAILIEICASFNGKVESLLKKKLSIIPDESIRQFVSLYINKKGQNLNPQCKYLIKELIEKAEDNLSVIPDKLIRDFANSCIENELQKQNPRYEHIKGLIGKFGNNYKKKLDKEVNKIEDRSIVVKSYDSLFNNRNDAAHSQSIKVTLGDVKDYYEKAHLVLDCLQSTLEVC